MSDESTTPLPGVPQRASAPATRDGRVGTVIAGKYRVIDRLGSGGMARIYRAEQLPLGRIVALKELLPRSSEADGDETFQQRFFLEASTLSRLTHPNTVRVFDYGQHEDGAFYMVMELVEGRTLAEVIREEGALQPLRAVHIAVEILRSLQEAHNHQVVHRDLKPANVMLVQTPEGEAVKVLDFGIAKVLHEESQSITVEDRIVGSPRYMAPEQIRHDPLGPATDLYSLGVLLFEMLTGRPPYLTRTTVQTLMAHINEPVPAVGSFSPNPLPESLEAVVTACLAKKPTARPQSAEDLREALREILVELASATTVTRLRSDSVIREALQRSAEGPPPVGLSGEEPPPTLDLARTRSLDAPSGGRGRIGAAALAALLLLGAIAGWGLTRDRGVEPVADAPEGPSGVQAVQVLSNPPGAEVWDGNRLHGITPLQLQTDDAPLVLELRLDGHQPAAVTVRPGEAGPLLVELQALAAVEAPAAPAQPRPQPRPAPSPPPEDLDILTER